MDFDMKFLCCGFLALCLFIQTGAYQRDPPKVQLYSREPGQFGTSNTLICHVAEFHPPDITIELLQNNVALPNPIQTDLAFKNNWHFHLTSSAIFTPQKGDKFLCRVTHGGRSTDYEWEPNM